MVLHVAKATGVTASVPTFHFNLVAEALRIFQEGIKQSFCFKLLVLSLGVETGNEAT